MKHKRLFKILSILEDTIAVILAFISMICFCGMCEDIKTFIISRIVGIIAFGLVYVSQK